MKQVKVTTANRGSGHLQDHITIFQNPGFGHVVNLDFLLPLPNQRLHRLARITCLVEGGDILLGILLVVADDLFCHICCLRGCHGDLSALLGDLVSW